MVEHGEENQYFFLRSRPSDEEVRDLAVLQALFTDAATKPLFRRAAGANARAERLPSRAACASTCQWLARSVEVRLGLYLRRRGPAVRSAAGLCPGIRQRAGGRSVVGGLLIADGAWVSPGKAAYFLGLGTPFADEAGGEREAERTLFPVCAEEEHGDAVGAGIAMVGVLFDIRGFFGSILAEEGIFTWRHASSR